MDSSPLEQKKCRPCEGLSNKLPAEKVAALSHEVDHWNIIDDNRIEKYFRFKDFREALDFVNQVGAIAESENHHPDIHIVDWNRVLLSLSTHAIGGLSENDFILAAKIDELMREKSTK